MTSSLIHDTRGKLHLSLQAPRKAGGFHLFEVFQDPGGGYVGYCDGERSTSSAQPDLALRGLERKHLVGLPEGRLIDFQAAKARLLEGRQSPS